MLEARDPSLRPLRSQPDPAMAVGVLFLGLTAVGLLLGGILAVYTYSTPGAVRPLFYGVIATFAVALGVPLLAAGARALRGGGG
jgi:hypothetical protein